MFGMIFREGQFLFLCGGILIRRFSLFFPLLLLRLRRGALISRYRMANSVAMMWRSFFRSSAVTRYLGYY